MAALADVVRAHSAKAPAKPVIFMRIGPHPFAYVETANRLRTIRSTVGLRDCRVNKEPTVCATKLWNDAVNTQNVGVSGQLSCVCLLLAAGQDHSGEDQRHARGLDPDAIGTAKSQIERHA